MQKRIVSSNYDETLHSTSSRDRQVIRQTDGALDVDATCWDVCRARVSVSLKQPRASKLGHARGTRFPAPSALLRRAGRGFTRARANSLAASRVPPSRPGWHEGRQRSARESGGSAVASRGGDESENGLRSGRAAGKRTKDRGHERHNTKRDSRLTPQPEPRRSPF